MRIGVLSYSMLFQREGALQVQVRETVRALNRLASAPGLGNVEVELVDPCRTRLDDYDLIHVFSATNGNHRIVEMAAELGVPVVLSPLISPGWTRANGSRARVADRVLGNLTHWDVQSSYAFTRRALQLSSLIVALSEAEREAIHSAFLIESQKVRVTPNGVSARFFEANETLFREHTGLQGQFALMVGSVSPYKNQLGIAQVLAEMALPFVVIGQAQERDTDYLRQLRAVPGVRWMGTLAHEQRLLASAYAAASVFVMPSQGESLPLSVLEALAAGTPVMMTEGTNMQLAGGALAVKKVAWNDASAQKRVLLALLESPPPRPLVRALVRDRTWDAVARQIASCYAEVVKQKEPAMAL